MGVNIWEGKKAQDLIDAIEGLPNATQAAADAANTAASETSRCNIGMTKSGGVITVTTTDRNNQQTSYNVTDPSGMLAPDFDASEANDPGEYVVNGDMYTLPNGHTAGTTWENTTKTKTTAGKELYKLHKALAAMGLVVYNGQFYINPNGNTLSA